MKWSRAIHHLEELQQTCAEMTSRPATIFPLRVTALWTFGEVLTNRDDLDFLRIVLAVDRPVEDVAWLCPPAGAEHWSNATRLSQSPVVAMWRSTQAPVWNHHIRRPLLVWDESGISDESGGIALNALSALRDGTAESLRLPEPTPVEMTRRLEAELAVRLRTLGNATAAYELHRFSPGKREPVADSLWRATQGYLEVRAATPTPHHKPRDRAGDSPQT
jgi:hypothetical protein